MYRGDGNESFHGLQLGGFILLVIGTFVFNIMRDKQNSQEQELSAESYRPLKETVNASDMNEPTPKTTLRSDRVVSI